MTLCDLPLSGLKVRSALSFACRTCRDTLIWLFGTVVSLHIPESACHHGSLQAWKLASLFRRHATHLGLRQNPILPRFSVTSRIVLATLFLTTLSVAVFSGYHFLHVKLMSINNFSHLTLRRFSLTGSFFSQIPPIHSIKGQSGTRLRLSVEGSPVIHGSIAFSNNIQTSRLEDHLALIPNVPRLSTNPPSANTLMGSSESFRNTTFPSKTYITWMRRGVREVVGAKGQVGNILYPADDGRSICHVAQILSSSQLLNVSAQMVHPFSQDLCSRARNSAWNGL